MRHRQIYDTVMEKHRWLEAHSELSAPDVPGAEVAVLVPYITGIARDRRDSERHFEEQNERIKQLYTSLGRIPTVFMRATVEDFERVLQDKRYTSVVTAGFGNISAIAVGLDRDKNSTSHAYLNWLHLAGMANHLKQGEFDMVQCCARIRTFNAPLGVGVVRSHKNILGEPGGGRYATDEIPRTPVTTLERLTYDDIRRDFQTGAFTPPEAENYSRLGHVARFMVDMGVISDDTRNRLTKTYRDYLNRHIGEIVLTPEKIPPPDVRDTKLFPKLKEH